MTNIFISIIRWIIFFPTVIIGLIFFIILSFINVKLIYKVSKPICFVLAYILGAKIKVKGHFPKDKKLVIMSNHCSFFDPFIYPFFMKGIYTGIVADYNLKFPLWKQFLLRLNAIPINRENRQEAIKGIQKAEQILDKGINIAILPEGTRTVSGKLGKLKKGGFHLAINTNTSIIPVGINGAFKLIPKTTWRLTPCDIVVKIGKPISTSIYNSEGVDGVLKIIENELKYLSGEINRVSSKGE